MCFIHKQLPFTLSASGFYLPTPVAAASSPGKWLPLVWKSGLSSNPQSVLPFILQDLVYIREIQNSVSFSLLHTVEVRAPGGWWGHLVGDHFFLQLANQNLPLPFFLFLPFFSDFSPKVPIPIKGWCRLDLLGQFCARHRASTYSAPKPFYTQNKTLLETKYDSLISK